MKEDYISLLSRLRELLPVTSSELRICDPRLLVCKLEITLHMQILFRSSVRMHYLRDIVL